MTSQQVNNAGAVLSREWYTAEGVGGSAQVNFLGPYTLTRLLEQELIQGAPSKVMLSGQWVLQLLLEIPGASEA
jgi:NAD(P)-dependent dehydrogenase (short-subunit alcohol dehydrogenase family)